MRPDPETTPPSDASPEGRPRARSARRVLHEINAYPHNVHPALVPGISVDEQRNNYRTDKAVFGAAALAIVAFIVWGIVSTDSLEAVSDTALAWVVANTGWFLSAIASVLFLFMVGVAVSRYGRIPLGRDGEKPEFSTTSWVAMIFSAGIGIGVYFFGAYEPMTFYLTPPPGSGVDPETREAMHTALAQATFHWGLNAWAIYALVGAAVAYSSYRRGRLPLMSSVLTPLLGLKRTEGVGGKLIDMFAIIATLFGTATSLGLGTLQIGRGVEIVSGAGDLSNTVLVVIIVVLTIAFVASAVSGVARGIRWLSNINMTIAVLLGLFVFVVGPTLLLVNLVPSVIAQYANDFMAMTGRSSSWGEDSAEFVAAWTQFYWAWWISWSPFVGIFIARISRGRTLRQFVGVVLVVPTLIFLLAFSLLGGTAMHLHEGGADLAVDGSAQDMFFALLGHLPGSTVITVVAVISICIFFITSADSAALVMGTLSQRGNSTPDKRVTIFWGLAMMGIAVVLLLLGGDDALQGMQNLLTASAMPFAVILVLMTVAFWRDLATDPMSIRHTYARAALQKAVVSGVEQHGDDFEISVGRAPAGEGAGADFDSRDESVTSWYQRTDEEGNPVDYDYATGEFLDAAPDDGAGQPHAPADQRP
ncbi:BCCT family transporter [Georgenia faecalis]|uniref:BCCT family transporter n=1 Tax=Georgenia faecalis TaxID=2483799 RepID=A0ABV9D5Z3_9MICO|nr:BCCT family transporter [Georgenia faecalis]